MSPEITLCPEKIWSHLLCSFSVIALSLWIVGNVPFIRTTLKASRFQNNFSRTFANFLRRSDFTTFKVDTNEKNTSCETKRRLTICYSASSFSVPTYCRNSRYCANASTACTMETQQYFGNSILSRKNSDVSYREGFLGLFLKILTVLIYITYDLRVHTSLCLSYVYFS